MNSKTLSRLTRASVLVLLFLSTVVLLGEVALYFKKMFQEKAITIALEEGVKVQNAKVPMYSEETGELSCLITAQELDYAFGKPAQMVKPVIFFYEKGKVKTIIKGDLGEIGFGTKFDPEKLKVWGNMKIQHFGGGEP